MNPYRAIAGAYVRSRLTYRLSFAARAAALAIGDLTQILLVGVVLTRFPSVGGWTWPGLALLFGLSQTASALARCVSVPFDHFDELIASGDFDGVLARPLSPMLTVIAGGVEVMNVGRVAVGVAVLVVACRAAGVEGTAGNVALMAAASAGGALLLFAMTLMVGALSFWTTRTGKLQDIVQSASRAFAEYPLSIYPGGIRFALTWILPMALVTYFPARRLLGMPGGGGWLAFAALPAGLLFLALGLLVWRLGLRRYQSTGS